MTRRTKYPEAVRRQAVRLVMEHRDEYESEWAAITSIASKSGMTAETLRKWVRQAEIDEGRRPGVTREESERVRRVERENRELRRANEMAKSTGERTGPVRIWVSRSQERRTITRWRYQIVAWHQARVSNGPTEAINNLVKRIKRIGFGFRRFAHYRIRVLLYAGKPNWDLLETITPR